MTDASPLVAALYLAASGASSGTYRPRTGSLFCDAAAEIKRQIAANAALCAEIKDLQCSVVAFGGPHAARIAAEFGLPDRHLFSQHYDILKRAGGRMDDFVRHEEKADD